MESNVWFLPIAIVVAVIVIAIPLSRYVAWIMDGKYRGGSCSAGSKIDWTPARRTGSSTGWRC